MTKAGIIKAGVIGWPVEHSLSPRLHGYWLKQYGISGRFDRIAAAPGQLAETLDRLAGEGYAGANLTIPHKEAVLDLLDGVEELAEDIGAVNLIVLQDDQWLGFNSDAYGFYQSVKAVGGRGKAVLMGAGGAARAVLAGLKRHEFQEIIICNRSREKAEGLAEQFGGRVVEWTDREAALEGCDLLVNSTSLGLSGQPELELRLDALPTSATVTDIVYKPLETGLLKAARARGCVTIDGLEMLMHQAVPAFEAFFGKRPEVTPELRAHLLAGL